MTAGLIIRLLFGVLFLTPAGEAVMLSLPFLILTVLKVRTETFMEKADETNKSVYSKKADTISTLIIKVYIGIIIFLFIFPILTVNRLPDIPTILSYYYPYYPDDFEETENTFFLLIYSWIITLLIPFLIILTVKIITERRMTTSDETQKLVYRKRSGIINSYFKVFGILAAVIFIFWTFRYSVAYSLFHV